MEFDNCQGNGTKFVSFELRRNKWNGWKELAGIWEFGETETDGDWKLEVRDWTKSDRKN